MLLLWPLAARILEVQVNRVRERVGGEWGRCSTVCGQYSMLYGTGAASKTERRLDRDQSQHAAQYSITERRLGLGQSQQRFCTVSRFFQKSYIMILGTNAK